MVGAEQPTFPIGCCNWNHLVNSVLRIFPVSRSSVTLEQLKVCAWIKFPATPTSVKQSGDELGGNSAFQISSPDVSTRTRLWRRLGPSEDQSSTSSLPD